jgi:hypothetical protein
MDTTPFTLSALWLIAFSFAVPVVNAGDPKPTPTLNRLVAETAAKIPLPHETPTPTPTPIAVSTPNSVPDNGIVRLYQVKSEVQLSEAKAVHSDSPAYVIQVSVDTDSVVLHDDRTTVRYKITGRRFIYQSEEGQEGMQSSAPAIVAARFDQGRTEILTVTPKRLTLLQSLRAVDGYRLTTAQYTGEKPLIGIDRSVTASTNGSSATQP